MIQALFIVNMLKRRGAEQQLFSFFKALPPSVAIHVFSFSNDRNDFPELFDCAKISIHTNPYSGTYNITRAYPLIECLRRTDIDVVVTVGLGAALVFGRLAAAMLNKKIIYSTLNTFENFNRLPRAGGAYFDYINAGINRLLPAISRDSILRFLPNSDQLNRRVAPSLKDYPVRTLHNGLPLDELADQLEAGASAKVKTILSEMRGRPFVIQVGALDANKNAGFTLQCMRSVKNAVRDACLVVVGDGPQKKLLEKWVAANGLLASVRFTGQLCREDCLALMKKADVLTLTSLSESFPNVLLEGQGLGLPAITFDVGAAAEIVKHGETGYVTPVDDYNEFTQKLAGLLADRDKRQAMGKRGLARVRRKFSMGHKVESFMAMLKEDMQWLETTKTPWTRR